MSDIHLGNRKTCCGSRRERIRSRLNRYFKISCQGILFEPFQLRKVKNQRKIAETKLHSNVIVERTSSLKRTSLFFERTRELVI